MQFARFVVLVDDDMDDHEVFKTACEVIDPGITVVSFESGEQALQEVSSMEMLPDVLFLDLNMPRLNGIEVLEAIKRDPRLVSVPIIVYTTSFDNKVKARCDALGATEVIEKPNSFDLLCEKLEALLKISV